MKLIPFFVLFFLQLTSCGKARESVSSIVMDSAVVGNGGDVVVCYDATHKIVSAELLDYYEARELSVPAVILEMGDAQLSWQKKVEVVLRRLSKLDPTRQLKYLKRAQQFVMDETSGMAPDAIFKRNITLKDTDDSYHIAVPDGCQVEQVAIQIHNDLPGRPTFTIDRELWDLLDEANKAGLVLHEIIYEELLSLGAKNSYNARYANSSLAGEQFKKTTQSEYFSFWKHVHPDLKVDRFIYDGKVFSGAEPKFYTDGKLQSGYVFESTRFTVRGKEEYFTGSVSFDVNGKAIGGELTSPRFESFGPHLVQIVEYALEGAGSDEVMTVTNGAEMVLHFGLCGAEPVITAGTELKFRKHEHLIGMKVYVQRDPTELCVGSKKIAFDKTFGITLHENGSVKDGKLEEKFEFKNGASLASSAYSRIEFFDSGIVSRACDVELDKLTTADGKIIENTPEISQIDFNANGLVSSFTNDNSWCSQLDRERF